MKNLVITEVPLDQELKDLILIPLNLIQHQEVIKVKNPLLGLLGNLHP
jgi:hypothetical protein